MSSPFLKSIDPPVALRENSTWEDMMASDLFPAVQLYVCPSPKLRRKPQEPVGGLGECGLSPRLCDDDGFIQPERFLHSTPAGGQRDDFVVHHGDRNVTGMALGHSHTGEEAEAAG
jgi:hypothetical protein